MYEFLNGHSPIYEIASERTINGRRHIKVVLHEIFPSDQQWNENGISWKEEYVANNLDSVAGMSIVVEFLTEDRDIPYSHGMTGVKETERARMAVFEDATMVGHFDSAYIGDVEIDGEMKRVLIAEGTLDEMRYPKFVQWLHDRMAESEIKGSVEITGKVENEGEIIYDGGWKEKGRVPEIYDYSGYAILGVKPADDAAIVMELNNKNIKEENNMDFEKLKDALIAEWNNKWDEYWAQLAAKDARIAELEAEIKDKEAEIAHVEEEKAQLRADFEAKEAGLAEANAKVEALEGEKAVLENEKAKAELNAALEGYTDEQREVATAEINAFNEKPGSIAIPTIVGKICTEIVRAEREAKIAEVNDATSIDVFSMAEETKPQDDDGEISVF